MPLIGRQIFFLELKECLSETKLTMMTMSHQKSSFFRSSERQFFEKEITLLEYSEKIFLFCVLGTNKYCELEQLNFIRNHHVRTKTAK